MLNSVITSAPPDNLINPDGQPRFGYFDGPITHLTPDKFDYRTVMDKPASVWSRHFHYKQFQFVSLVTPEYVVGVALANIRYLGSGFVYLYNIKSNQLQEISWLQPKGIGYTTTPSPVNSVGSIKNGKGSVTFTINEGHWKLSIQSRLVNANIELEPQPSSHPLVLCNPTGYNGWTYTQKHNALSVSGTLEVSGKPVSLSDALAGYDFSAGYMRRDTSWRWASINGSTPAGQIGLNLASGVNETGLNENAFWFNGERHLLGPVQFEFDRQNTDSSWRITSVDGRISLNFQPINRRQEKLNLWLLKSNFRQFIGYFSGWIVDGHGTKHQLDTLLGLTEDHYARW